MGLLTEFTKNENFMKKLTSLTLFCLGLISSMSLIAAPVQIKMETNRGNIILELYPEKSPISVGNFVKYVNDGFYDGTVFHRVISSFMIQGGGFDEDLNRKTTREKIQNEASNGLKNTRGTISMVRLPDPHSATSQFFINVQDNPALDYTGDQTGRTWGYAVFGKVIEGLDVVDEIRFTQTGPNPPFPGDVPIKTMLIKKMTVINKMTDDSKKEKPEVNTNKPESAADVK